MVILAVALLFFGVHWSYVAIMAAKRAPLNLYWKVILFPLAAIGLVLDAAFNAVFGTLAFLEVPRELLFSARVQRHVRGDGWRLSVALFFARQLNIFDEHIKL